MHRRSLLKMTLPLTGTILAGCSMPLQSQRPTPSDISSFITFLEATPADQPLVIDGLDSEGTTNEVWGRLFTEQPEIPVFTDRIEDVSPYMQSQLNADRYDERFFVLVQKRFSTPKKLFLTTPHPITWVDSNRLQVPLESQSIKEPSDDLRMARSVVATTLLIFTYKSSVPESVVLPIRRSDGESITKIVAR